MKKLIALLILYIIRFALWFRYRVTIKGAEHLNPQTLNKTGGVLFLPNHPTVFVDPSLITIAVWKKYPVRPMVVEYMYYTPIINSLMRFMDALPVPHFGISSNSLKKKQADKVLETVIEGLKQGENFLIYPAGRTKHQAKEIISGSGIHRIIQSTPNLNIVLVRITGLWGSSFSSALTGKTPLMFKNILWGIGIAIKNLLFFTPRRNVTIEFMPAGQNFPAQASRIEMNHYLEKWYNRPDYITPQASDEPGESLYLVPYSLWDNKLPEIKSAKLTEDAIDVSTVPLDTQIKIKEKLSEMSNIPIAQINPEMDLSADLGLDSLDNAELIAFLDDQFDLPGVPVGEVTTVSKLMGLAAKKIDYGQEETEEEQDIKSWYRHHMSERVSIAEGSTIPEVFLNNCQRMSNAIACGDAKAGVLTYKEAKMRVILLAQTIRNMPGNYIGIMLPSSVAAYLTILACQLAGKVPLLINWTVGSRHLESVVTLSQVQVILSSWAFLDRLSNVDLTPVEELIVTLEDLRRTFTIKDKLKAFYRSKLHTNKILSLFGVADKTKYDQAVLLFTSGTENLPKGVPLSHENILSNQRGAVHDIELFQNDVLLGMLPPFHSFGFTVSGLLPLLADMRVVYFPDPTNGRGLVQTIAKWQVSLICGAPSFLKAIFKNADKTQLQTMRICVTGAEKAPEELFKMVNSLKHCILIEGYGITECSPILAINVNGNTAQGVGKPLEGTQLCIVSLENHQAVPQGTRGLILARGPNIFSGYLNSGISSPFINHDNKLWYITGDLGYFDSNGYLILSGRLKRFIKIGGEMISLAAIEDALLKTIAQREECALEGPKLAVCAQETAGEKTKIFVFTRFKASLDEVNSSLREAGFSNLIKAYKVYQLSEIPLMGSGKINYRALENQLLTYSSDSSEKQINENNSNHMLAHL